MMETERPHAGSSPPNLHGTSRGHTPRSDPADMLVVIDPGGRLLHRSLKADRLSTGQGSELAGPGHLMDLLHTQDPALLSGLLSSLTPGATLKLPELSAPGADGQPRRFEAQAHGLSGRDDNTAVLIHLLEAGCAHRLPATTGGEGMLILDSSGRLQFASPHLLQRLVHSPFERPGWGGNEQPAAASLAAAATTPGRPLAVNHDGKFSAFVTCSALYDATGGRTGTAVWLNPALPGSGPEVDPAELARTMLESNPDCVKILDLDGRLQSMNEFGRCLLEIEDLSSIHGTHWPSLWREGQGVAESALRAARAGGTGRFQGACPTFAGTLKWWDVIVTPTSGPDGHPAQLLVVSRDITDLQAAQEQVRTQAQQLAALLGRITDAFCSIDHEWRLTFVNEHASHAMGRPASELVGKKVWDLVPEARDGEVGVRFRQALAEQRVVQLEAFFAPHDAWYRLRAYPSPDGLLVFFQDVTASKAAGRLELDRSRVLEMTVQGERLPAVLNELALLVERQLPGAYCVVTQQLDHRLYTVAAPTLPGTFREAIEGMPLRPEGAPLAAFERRQAGAVDIRSHPDWEPYRELALLHGITACVSLPVTGGPDEAPGTLDVYLPRQGPLDARDEEVLNKAHDLATIVLEHARMKGQLAFQAQHDPLTGLPNRQYFAARLEQALESSQQSRKPLAVLYLDLNDFKTINDTLGHETGDQVLSEVARRLRSSARAGDTVARLGGDEFTVVLPYTDRDTAVLVAERILAAFSVPARLAERELYLRPSIGIAVSPQAGRDPATLLRHADMAMYRAKRRRDGFAVFESEMNRRSLQRLQLTSDLRAALESGEFELHYQPQVKLQDGTLAGMEALLRWAHPRLGLVAPSEFIPLAEETGLIVPIGEWVLREACRQSVAWEQAGQAPFVVAVNVSAVQFDREDFVETVATSLRDYGLAPHRLELELTGSAVMQNVQEAALRLSQLRELGVSLSLDDFGVGYSNLAYLQQLPLHVLKIDRSFVKELTRPGGSIPIVKAAIGLAQHLDLTTVAEGVETSQELAALRRLRCDAAQGYLFSKPLPAAEVLRAVAALPGAAIEAPGPC